MAYLLVFGIVVALTLATTSLYRYGNVQRQHPLVTLSVLTAWSFSFLIVFTIPLDVTSTVYRQCLSDSNKSAEYKNITPSIECQQPWGMVPESVFPNLWLIIYWTSQLLTWLIMPLMQSYLKAGDFTVKGKLKAAIIDNAIYYGSYLFICGILLIYLALKPNVHLDRQKLKAIASSASNTWGLFLLVLLLGYALVEVPRRLWHHSKRGVTLKQAYFKLAKLSTDKADAEENVDDVLESLNAVNIATPMSHDLRPCVDTIIRRVPAQLMERAKRNMNRYDNNQSNVVPSEKSLIRLHKQVIKSIQTFERTEALWNVQVSKVLHLQDIERNADSVSRVFKTQFPQHRSKLQELFYNPVLDWYWQSRLRPPFLRSLAVMTGTLSLLVVWSELTFFNRSPVLSVLANVVNFAKSRHDFLTIELFSMITLCYLCYCAYSTVFRIKFLNLYYLAPHHATNEHSLIFSGMLLCRLTPPMCLNFLSLIHMDSHIIKSKTSETYYTQIMGHMDVLEIISDGFNIYFPMVMLAFCLATWYSLGSRALNALGFQQFMLDESESGEFVEEGKNLIEREIRRRQRTEESLIRRRDMSSRGAGISKYRLGNNFANSSRRVDGPRASNDGLLDDGGETNTYEATQIDGTRSISDEISDRFGESTSIQIGFRGYNYIDSDNNMSGQNRNKRNDPPRDLFDDV